MTEDPGFHDIRVEPSFKIFANGAPLPQDIVNDLIDISVSLHVEGASMFTFRLNIRDLNTQDFKHVDDNLLGPGAAIEVRAGFGDNVKSLIKGEVTALEAEYTGTEAPTLKVHGYDRLHRLRRGRKTKTYVKVKDSDIARQVATAAGLTCTAEDTKVVYDYVLQDNMSDIDFLLQRARRINYEVVVDDKELLFRKTPINRTPKLVLTYGLSLTSFYPRLTTVGQVNEVKVQGWDPKKKQAVVARVASSTVDRMGGTTTGPDFGKKAFSDARLLLAERPVLSQEEAQQAAEGKIKNIALDFITGEAESIGNPDILAGIVVDLKGLGKRFSGRYYVTSATHTVNTSGYSTRFTVARTAA